MSPPRRRIASSPSGILPTEASRKSSSPSGLIGTRRPANPICGSTPALLLDILSLQDRSELVWVAPRAPFRRPGSPRTPRDQQSDRHGADQEQVQHGAG